MDSKELSQLKVSQLFLQLVLQAQMYPSQVQLEEIPLSLWLVQSLKDLHFLALVYLTFALAHLLLWVLLRLTKQEHLFLKLQVDP